MSCHETPLGHYVESFDSLTALTDRGSENKTRVRSPGFLLFINSLSVASREIKKIVGNDNR